MLIKCTNGWRYGVGLPCRHFYLTTTVTGKLHYTACCVSGAVKFAHDPIKSTIVVIYFSECWQKK